MSIINTENPAIWYPYYGSWFIALVVEAILFTLCLTHGLSSSAFVYAQTAVQAYRILVLVLLSTVLFTKSSKDTETDEESASLLGHSNKEPSGTHTPIGKPAYGSVTVSAEIDADTESEDEDLRNGREKKEMIEKRLQAEGNWFT